VSTARVVVARVGTGSARVAFGEMYSDFIGSSSVIVIILQCASFVIIFFAEKRMLCIDVP